MQTRIGERNIKMQTVGSAHWIRINILGCYIALQAHSLASHHKDSQINIIRINHWWCPSALMAEGCVDRRMTI